MFLYYASKLPILQKKYTDPYLYHEANRLKVLAMLEEGRCEDASGVLETIIQSPYATQHDSLLMGIALCGINRLEEAKVIADAMHYDSHALKHAFYIIYTSITVILKTPCTNGDMSIVLQMRHCKQVSVIICPPHCLNIMNVKGKWHYLN